MISGSKTETSYAVEADGLVRRFGTVEALAHVTLAVRKGEFFSLLGPSGCGKTTLLRLIAGLDVPDAGSLRINGVDMASVPAHKRPVNTVFQSYALFPHLTAWDNIAFGLRMKRVPVEEIRIRVGRVLAMLEAEPFARRRPAQLSGGQKQRVALARAVVNEPDVLLLDEPLGALDLKLRKQLQVELHQLQRRLGITFIYVTHDQEGALVMSDRVAVMNEGQVEQLDSAHELYERPKNRFVAQFLGSCNLLAGRIAHVTAGVAVVETALGNILADTSPAARPCAPGEQVTVAIRPEKITLSSDGDSAVGNRVKVKVEELFYNGAETQYLLRCGGEPIKAVALNTQPGRQGLHTNSEAWFQFTPASCIILAD